MRFKPEGIISAMVTPFTKGGTYVDFDKVGPLAQWLAKHGANGLFPCGTTGECMLMSDDERKEVLEEVVAAVGKTNQVVAHVGAFDTATTIELAEHAAASGAHACAVVAPGYFAYDDKALKAHFKSVAKAVDGFPVLLYNIPSCARNSISDDLIIDLAESVDNIVGLKDSSGNMVHLSKVMGRAPKGFHVINGVDEYGYQAFAMGTKAAVSGSFNVTLERYANVYKYAAKGDMKRAWKAQTELTKACGVLLYGGMASVFKEGMRLRGFDAGYVRPPQRELSAAEKRNLAKNMEAIGLI